MIAVGTGKEAKIVRFETDHWQICELLGGHTGVVRDIAWAPNMGRSFEIIATACSDGHVRIFHLTKANGFSVDLVADFDEHASEVWKVEWNVTGTILSSSGDDGVLRLWKCI